ncbi:MAG: DtxR family transcriptional regulator [Spartobacteria bacterium]|nr:DtxR family transcriptional regulator [Spartobacteria bacterium]
MAISAALEDYLEAIWMLSREGGGARTTDIANRLSVRKPSVTEMLQTLAEKKLVHYKKYAAVTLTDEGEALAKAVVRKHEILRLFLTSVLCIDPAVADEQACLLEHAASREVIDRLVQFTEFIETCPRAGLKWIRGLSYQCSEMNKESQCRPCIESCLTQLEEAEKMREQTCTSILAEAMDAGDRGVVEKIEATGALRLKLAEMGVSRGVTIEVVRKAPMGDPIDFKIRGYHLSLRKTEAAAILVQVHHD